MQQQQLPTMAARRLLLAPATTPGPFIADDRDIIIILASLLCALICVLSIGLVARCACGRRLGVGPDAAAAAANRGVKKSVLRAIPTVAYVAAVPAAGKGKAAEDDDDGAAAECAICLAEFEDGEAMRVLPQCGHAFHALLPPDPRRPPAARPALPALRRAPRPRRGELEARAPLRRDADVPAVAPTHGSPQIRGSELQEEEQRNPIDQSMSIPVKFLGRFFTSRSVQFISVEADSVRELRILVCKWVIKCCLPLHL